MIFLKSNKKIQLFISKYQLKAKSSYDTFVEGCLLLFDFGGGLRGYSDFLPWPLYGEKTLSEQLEDIKHGSFSSRFLIAKEQAFIDAKARRERKNLFFSLKIPPSHFLIENLHDFHFSKEILDFKFIKVKLKSDKVLDQVKILKKLNHILKNIKWRFDLNGKSWKPWSASLSFLKNQIDFIEDPKETEPRAFLAEDWRFNPYSRIKIVKSSRDSLKDLVRGWPCWKRIIFTHSFDHPLGQATSAFWAGLFYKYYPRFFETGAFINTSFIKLRNYELNFKGDSLIVPSGYGFGFSKALENENWRRWL